MYRRLAVLAAALVVSSHAFAVEHLTPKQAETEAANGNIVLIDIRTPDEWAETGVAPKAHPLDMTSPDFTDKLKVLITGNPGKTVAFVCRTGHRSGMLAERLEAAGMQNVADVQGGMTEWVSEGLPVSKP